MRLTSTFVLVFWTCVSVIDCQVDINWEKRECREVCERVFLISYLISSAFVFSDPYYEAINNPNSCYSTFTFFGLTKGRLRSFWRPQFK